MEKMFTSEENNDEVKRAIKTLMDLEPMERAITEHLPAAARRLAKEIDKGGDSRLQQLRDQQESLEQQRDDAARRAQKVSRDISSYESEVREMERALRSHSESKPLQNARKKLEWKINEMGGQLQDRYARKREILSKGGFLAFTSHIDETVIGLAEAMRERRQLPAGIQRDFIEGPPRGRHLYVRHPCSPGERGISRAGQAPLQCWSCRRGSPLDVCQWTDEAPR
ncbi:chromosome segregation ATPase [Streptomyces ambofaciens]